jgi:RNA polymerase sigma-70 factor (ECF subfamily)
MTKDEFSERIINMTDTLYRISCSQLSRACDRDDAVQETICKAWAKRNKLKEERYMQTWVVRILINECHNIERKQRRMILSEEIILPYDDPYTDTSLRDAVKRLDENIRRPIVLHYIEEYTIAEIAKIMRIPQGTVKTRLMRGRKQLFDILEEQND